MVCLKRSLGLQLVLNETNRIGDTTCGHLSYSDAQFPATSKFLIPRGE